MVCGRSDGLLASIKVLYRFGTPRTRHAARPPRRLICRTECPGVKFQTTGVSKILLSRMLSLENLPSLKNYIGSAKSFFQSQKKKAKITPRASTIRHRPRHHQHQKPHAEHHPSDHGAGHDRGICPRRSCPAKVASQAEPQKKHEG
jgi:hypothetical protein